MLLITSSHLCLDAGNMLAMMPGNTGMSKRGGGGNKRHTKIQKMDQHFSCSFPIWPKATATITESLETAADPFQAFCNSYTPYITARPRLKPSNSISSALEAGLKTTPNFTSSPSKICHSVSDAPLLSHNQPPVLTTGILHVKGLGIHYLRFFFLSVHS